MKNEKTLVFFNYSDAHGHYIYIYVKEYGLFILEDKLDENAAAVRVRHWEDILHKVSTGMLVGSRDEALMLIAS